jgi:hypothetical protein
MRRYSVIPSEVENEAAEKPQHRREGHALGEREVSESNPVALPGGCFAGFHASLRSK